MAGTWLQVVWKEFGLPVTIALKGHVSKEVRRNWFNILRDTDTSLQQKVTSKFTALLSIEIWSKQKRDLVWSKLAGWMSWTPGRGLTPRGSAALNWGIGIIVRPDIWVDSFVLGDFCLSGLCWCIWGHFFFFILVVSFLRRFVERGWKCISHRVLERQCYCDRSTVHIVVSAKCIKDFVLCHHLWFLKKKTYTVTYN